MSLADFIEKIQKKPRYIRIQVLWLAVFVCMFFIVSLWVVSMKSPLAEKNKQKTEKLGEISQPLEEIKKEIPSLKEAFRASIGAFFEKDLEEEIEKADNQPEEINQEINQMKEEPEKIQPAKLPLIK